MYRIATTESIIERMAEMNLDECIEAACWLGMSITTRAVWLHFLSSERTAEWVYPDANERTAVLSDLLDRMRELIAQGAATTQDLLDAQEVSICIARG